jgi:uncharacterized protein involved in exopolysaccharide biosynthesis
MLELAEVSFNNSGTFFVNRGLAVLRRFLEVIFRRPLLLLLLLVLLPLMSLAIAYVLPRSYQSTASLWALHRYAVIGASGPESDLQSTPAETQATTLTELLQARAFALSVAKATSLPSTLAANVQADPQALDDALYTEISKNVVVGAQGYNLFVITYTNANPQVTQQVIQAVIQNFGLQTQGFSVVEGQHLLEGLQTELAKAKQDAATAAAADSKYISNHPSLTKADLLSDPQYGLLHAQTLQDQATLTNIQTNIATISQEISAQGAGSDNLFKVLDAPALPDRPVSRLKTLLLGGGVGLGIAVLACILYVLIAIRRDRTVYTPLDLQKVTALPVIMQIPHLAETTVLQLAKSVSSGNMQ